MDFFYTRKEENLMNEKNFKELIEMVNAASDNIIITVELAKGENKDE